MYIKRKKIISEEKKHRYRRQSFNTISWNIHEVQNNSITFLLEPDNS